MSQPTSAGKAEPQAPRVIPLSAQPEEYAAYIDAGARVSWDETGYFTARRQGQDQCPGRYAGLAPGPNLPRDAA